MAKTVVITGTASGFGRASVQRFAREGWNVVATVRKESDQQVHADVDNVRTLLLDVNDEAADTEFAAKALEQFGKVDALVNNAGYYHMGPVEASSMEQIHQQFQTNVFGLIALTKAFVPIFRQQRSGVVVNLSSISADQGYPFTAVYAASKAAVAAFTEGLNVEMSRFRRQREGRLPRPAQHPYLRQDRQRRRRARGLPRGNGGVLRVERVRFGARGNRRRHLRSGHRRQGQPSSLLLRP
jgi:NADP-dependent 3-hydroxy acid dehydrogenase YdfG